MGFIAWRDSHSGEWRMYGFSTHAFDEVGGFSENYQYSYADIDFCLKLKSNNLDAVWTPEAKVYHFGARTRGDAKPLNLIYRSLRNDGAGFVV
jgi:GT2 family glycosyltransferase